MKDGEARHVVIHGDAESWPRLSDWTLTAENLSKLALVAFFVRWLAFGS